MIEEIKMPQMGESVAEGTIVRWLKQVGESVKRDEPLFEISTDKVDAEIPSPVEGVLVEILAKEGETVPVNTTVAIIAPEGTVPVADLSIKQPETEITQPEPPSAEPAKEIQTPPAVIQPPSQPAATEPIITSVLKEEGRPIRSSPLVRKIARENNVDLSLVSGTGFGGRITKHDIMSYLENRPAARPSAPALTLAGAAPEAPPVAIHPDYGPQPFNEDDRVTIEPMSVMRKKIAGRMVESKRISAHVGTFMEVDFTETAKVRESLKGEYLARDGVKLTFMPFIINATVEGIKKWPIINSSVWGDQIVYKKDINIGVAVALDWGLIVPVIRNADEKSLLGLAKAVNDFGERARTKRLKPDEVHGGTFTITNPGGFGSLAGTPIINQPQVAILGVGAIKKRPVVINDAIAIRQIGILSLSFDHRVIDGAVADQFMAVVRDVIESASYTS